MIPKLRPLQKQIFAYIDNAVELDMDIKDIVKEVAIRFPTYYIFHKVNPEMQLELIEQLVWMRAYIAEA